jgi:hypothetical protein
VVASDTEPRSAPPLTVRPTTADGPRRWHRFAGIGLVAVAVVLVVAVVIAWFQDRDNHYPGFHNEAEMSELVSRVLAPTNAKVDAFTHDGPLRAVGPWPWKAAVGGAWVSSGGFAHAPSSGGVTVVDPGRAQVIAQVDVFAPVGGAGLVFRWKDAADHFSIEVSPHRSAWQLVRTVHGERTVLRTVPVNPQGTDVRVILSGDHIEMDVNGAPRFIGRDDALLGATPVGLTAPTGGTEFAQFAVLAG